MRKTGMYGSAGQSLKCTDPTMIMTTGMTMVTEQAMVQPIVPTNSKISLSRKSRRLREALWVSRMRPKRES